MMKGSRQSQSSVCSLFEDLDPDSSPLMKHLEAKRKSGAKLSDEDFTESFPLFKKKMEKDRPKFGFYSKRYNRKMCQSKRFE